MRNIEQTVNSYIEQATNYADKGEFDAALAIFNKLLETYKNHDVLLFHKARTLQKAQRYTESKKVYEAAIKANYKASYVSSLCEVLWALKEYKQVYQQIARAHLKEPLNYDILFHELRFDLEDSNYEQMIRKAEHALKHGEYNDIETGVLNTYLAIAYSMQPPGEKLSKAVSNLQVFLQDDKTHKLPTTEQLKQLQNYARFLNSLQKWRSEHSDLYEEAENKIYVVSNSHALSAAYVKLANNYQIIPKLIWNARAYFMHQKSDSKENEGLKRSIRSIPQGAKVIFQIGEIDCRPNAGFFKRFLKGNFDIEAEISKAVAEHVNYLLGLTKNKDFDLYFATVHAPNQNYIIKNLHIEGLEHAETYMKITKLFNAGLKEQIKHRAKILDIYEENHALEGMGKQESFIDIVHLYPSVIKAAIEKQKII